VFTNSSGAFTLTTFKLSSLGKTSQKRWIEKVEKRLSITSSMLGNMKAVKMLGLTDKMFEIVHHLQWIEVETSRQFRKVFIVEVFFCKCLSLSIFNAHEGLPCLVRLTC
jgi:hypothetical protein